MNACWVLTSGCLLRFTVCYKPYLLAAKATFHSFPKGDQTQADGMRENEKRHPEAEKRLARPCGFRMI